MNINRYWNLLRTTNFGISLSKIAVLNYLKHKIIKRTVELTPSRLAPVFVSVFITSRCNLQCPFCIYGKSEKESKYVPWQDYEVTLESLTTIIDHEMNKRCLIVCLQGGEPLLNKELPDMIRIIRKRGKLCGIISNGLLLSDCYKDILKSGLCDTQISIYDHTFERLSKILPKLNSIKKVNASYPLTRSVLEKQPEQIEEIIRMCKDTGCMSVKFNIIVPFIKNGIKDYSETIYDDNQFYKEMKQKITEKFKGYDIYFPGGSKLAISFANEKKCLNPWQFASYDAKGNLGLCCAYTPDPQGKFGNLFCEGVGVTFYANYANNF
jgi:MoaA/NifB/PqqE/SkfB family radical SAM enzyme